MFSERYAWEKVRGLACMVCMKNSPIGTRLIHNFIQLHLFEGGPVYSSLSVAGVQSIQAHILSMHTCIKLRHRSKYRHQIAIVVLLSRVLFVSQVRCGGRGISLLILNSLVRCIFFIGFIIYGFPKLELLYFITDMARIYLTYPA